ncbi:DUF2804 domain-containing protein [Mycoplasmatota bacterium zrk1]
MQNRIIQKQKLLNEKGYLNQSGYSTEILLEYSRKDIKGLKSRIKEWDYYLVTNEDFGVALTIADNSYMGFVSVAFFNFKEKWCTTKSKIKPFTRGGLNLPSSTLKGDVKFSDKTMSIEFVKKNNQRHLKCSFNKFLNKDNLSCDIILKDEPIDSIVLATPFKKNKKAFYYNQKINCLRAEGELTLGDSQYIFDSSKSFGVLDWGRGVWTYKNTWYWGSASGIVDGKIFGFNIGYGFGDTSKATENMIFYDGVGHKLEHVDFIIPRSKKEDYMKTWSFTSSDGRFEMTFDPIIDRYDNINMLILSSCQHQVFGKFTGTVILDDGTKLLINDLFGFAEKVSNKW